MAGRAARRLHCVCIRAAPACILRTCVRAAFLFNILTLYYICKSMKWQDFGRINKDKFAAAAESGRQPCGCQWIMCVGCAPGEMAWKLGFDAGLNGAGTGVRRRAKWRGNCVARRAKCIFTRKKADCEGGFVYKFTDIGILPLHKQNGIKSQP